MRRVTARRLVLVAFIAVVVTLVGMTVAYAATKTDPARALALLDRLDIPPSWQFAHAETVRGVILLSRVERFYLVKADPEQVAGEARAMVAAAGLPFDQGGPKDCRTNGPGGPMSCWIPAHQGNDRLDIVVFSREEAAFLAGDPWFAASTSDQIVVRMTVTY